jgi:diguanylate cyclase (GGDEF)-like protein/PAS domain S-box-containing protein
MPKTVLLIQDDPEDAGKVLEALSRSNGACFQVEWVRQCSEGIERLTRVTRKQAQFRPSRVAAVLIDLFLPDSQGIGTFDQVFLAAPQVPILVLSARQDEGVAKLAVLHGAQVYLLKDPFEGYILPNALANSVAHAANAEALFEERQRSRVTLDSITDAIICTDVWDDVTHLNTIAERLTGWSKAAALGHPLTEVFRLIDATTRQAARKPTAKPTRYNSGAGLTANGLLIRRDGEEFAIEGSAAPICDRNGQASGAVLAFQDVTKTRALTLEMLYLEQHDKLTDLPNRLLLIDRLTQAIAFASRHDDKVGVLVLDLDGFKHINESLGHDVGDKLLQSVAQRLLQCTRKSDTVSRQEGNEFVVLLPEVATAMDAGVSAQKILLALSSVHHIDPHDLYITPSIGIVTCPDDGTDADILLQHADVAKTHAKTSGGNNCQFFRPEMNARAMARRSLETDLCRALERREFQLHYQPKVVLCTGVIIGAEALIRWRHPHLGLVPPGRFVPIAEECGFITTVGRWVLREACRQTRAWQDAGLPSLCMAINVSAVELRDRDYVAAVRSVLTETGLRPDCLELELTETFLMQDSQATATVIEALKDIGVRIALDDFGTGYSSLSYLKRFPIDTLKIDRSYVCNITTDRADACIVSAVIAMGKGLHMQVLAEGVETQEQLTFLRERDCPEGQGYFFNHPVVADEFAALLKRGVPNRVLVMGEPATKHLRLR